jgi:hypothetical protein
MDIIPIDNVLAYLFKHTIKITFSDLEKLDHCFRFNFPDCYVEITEEAVLDGAKKGLWNYTGGVVYRKNVANRNGGRFPEKHTFSIMRILKNFVKDKRY